MYSLLLSTSLLCEDQQTPAKTARTGTRATAATSAATPTRRRPQDLEAFSSVHGVGKRKLAEYGPRFVEVIVGDERAGAEMPVTADE